MLKRVLLLLAAAVLLPAVPATPAAADDVLGQLAGDLQAAHDLATGRGVTIAILSDGVDPELRELTGRLRVAPDLVKRAESDPRFGTLLASMIAGRSTISGQPIKGIAPAATILSVRVRPSSIATHRKFVKVDSLDKVAAGIRYATDHGAKVVLVEEERGSLSREMMRAIGYALRKNVVIVTSAQRLVTSEGKPAPHEALSFPAAIPGVIVVGATDDKGRWLGKRSARNDTVLLSAPGTRVYATGDGNQGGWYIDGSPVAAAWVAGTAALIKEKYPEMSPGAVAQALAASVRNRPSGGYQPTVGNGMLNPAQALKQADELSSSPDSAVPGTYAVEPSARFGGPPPPPIRAAQWDESTLIRYGSISAGGFLLLLISLVVAAAAVIRRRRKSRELGVTNPGPRSP
ncbi:S8 family serine peptidase [Sphaerimonospora thailandensis]|uniref:Peptidase S8/S53 domain-containing protein n=1 Tax=Sphaerimonospora thailandensis TaxID=795644 RepID=A0A8J3RHU0_9ACTN|nr:S8 family serine peptidase [Sphaerimonospora thailandensis]GIH72613.1 hypothetical protein Mth01_48660 [Sphaerimonospora thailandensis]